MLAVAGQARREHPERVEHRGAEHCVLEEARPPQQRHEHRRRQRLVAGSVAEGQALAGDSVLPGVAFMRRAVQLAWLRRGEQSHLVRVGAQILSLVAGFGGLAGGFEAPGATA